MDKHVTWTPEGVCASEICFDIVDGIIHNVNLPAAVPVIPAAWIYWLKGMPAADVVKRLRSLSRKSA